ncbi:division plane positioning ATPase MipZ [Piscirickettsia salmonis]|uniref:division plane positioning ATPase MipZ n=1 Tax=Piscirickettsia salmonis TaxID=1238 RepID=UPI001EE3DDC7|nr:division plane positioning ATPase MipZ [Piscirickettsia salmonis]
MQEQGKDVLLFDADRTENSSSWNHIRNENKTLKRVNSVQGYGNILTQLADLSERYDDIVIDTAGKDSQEFRYALAVADIALIPFRCSMFDLKTLPQVSDIISTMRPTNPKLHALLYFDGNTNPIMKEVFQTSQRVEKLKRDGLIDELTFWIQ